MLLASSLGQLASCSKKLVASSQQQTIKSDLRSMAKKKPFVLRLNPDTLEKVEKWAADEFRSTNGQLEWIIDAALKKSGRKK